MDLKEKLRDLPTDSGIYIHKDDKGKIIYIGKAKNLKNRVRQYFQSSRKKDAKTRRLMKQIVDFEYIVTDTEKEALVLESNLIKKHKPKYNVLLKDDKYMDSSTNADKPIMVGKAILVQLAPMFNIPDRLKPIVKNR